MSGTQRLTLTEDLTIYTAIPLKDKLVAALAGCDELELDLSQVSEIDTAGFQLLVMAKREATRLSKALRVVAHSATVRELLDFYNTVAYFGDPLHIPAHE
jgi:anti-anti-sigma factor